MTYRQNLSFSRILVRNAISFRGLAKMLVNKWFRVDLSKCHDCFRFNLTENKIYSTKLDKEKLE